MTTASPKKFEDTQLLQHPEVASAYQFYLDAKARGDEQAELVEEFGLKTAESLSQLLVNKDPNVVAAMLLLPFASNAETEEDVERLTKAAQPLTLEYMEAFNMMIHPFGISEVFPQLPETHKTASIVMGAGMHLSEIRELEKHAARMSPRELYSALTQEEPTMPKFEEFVSYARLRKTEPQLMAAYDAIRKPLMDIATGKAPARKPIAPDAPTP